MAPLSLSGASKKFINDVSDCVTEMIDGMVETFQGLQRLDGFPEVKVVLRTDVSRGTYNRVAVISGGGSGHEPAHAGYVGQGMLTAAVCGDIFASPTVAAVLAAIRAVTGAPGCLLIVKNYTGDRLNFGLAAEQAKAEGYKVEMVIVGDDCALPPPRGLAGRRGLAGTLFVHKVAGAAAAEGKSLGDVLAEAQSVAGAVGTMGVALMVCTLPGATPSDRLGAGKMELGLGIHGEPGAAVADVQPVDAIVSHVLQKILDPETQYLKIDRGERVVLMVNGLGATPQMELLIAAGKAVATLQVEYGLAVERVYTGSFMTSLDMAGMSLSVLRVTDRILQRLDAPTRAPAWPSCAGGPRPMISVPVPMPSNPTNETAPSRPAELSESGRLLEAAIRAGAEALVDMEQQLNEWDARTGDGDCGTSMRKGAAAVLDDIWHRYPLNDAAETVKEVGASVRHAMGGTIGVLYDVFCRAAYASLRGTSSPSPLDWAAAFEAAVSSVSKYGGAAAGYRTMLDALLPASKTLTKRLQSRESPGDAFVAAAHAAAAGAEETLKMVALAGRSSYVPPEVLSQVPDPGAKAAAAWLNAAAAAVALYTPQ
ncbi:hypothetical protein KFL_000060860 [Klebsormidium nitens]|uniref:Dihydroxyacetone kinase n=1 Tax=Klebsormidium nitens TaxID=105231 RepID=A0A0U9HTK0_KLENI|nr:hypothetical protein KFL_000060860 [Klebsormidium nitens]|eukprot:GAQ78019.1 hypothetical protein KFL_000060860 [Klebsormidium nitens]